MNDDKKIYIYLMTLEIGGKEIAKYVGKRESHFSQKDKRILDDSYLGSGTCWKWLREEYGFIDKKNKDKGKGKKWTINKNGDSGYFNGTHNARFTIRVIHEFSNKELSDNFEQSMIKLMIKSEGLNLDLIKRYRKYRNKNHGKPIEGKYLQLDKKVKNFLKKYGKIKNGRGFFVNQLLPINEEEQDNE